MEREVKKCVPIELNYGKAAKRMYNVFRLTGRHAEAAFVRELFDEPTTLLYQVWALVRALDEACKPRTAIAIEQVSAQADNLILDVVRVLEGGEEHEIVRRLLTLCALSARHETGAARSAEAQVARQQVINVVNNFFHEKLLGLPAIERYLQLVQA